MAGEIRMLLIETLCEDTVPGRKDAGTFNRSKGFKECTCLKFIYKVKLLIRKQI